MTAGRPYRIDCADCMTVLATCPARSYDAIITDIPYNNVNRPGSIRSFDKGAADSARVHLRPLVRECARIARGWVYIWCAAEQISRLLRLMQHAGMSTRLGVWVKPDPSPINGQYTWTSDKESCAIGRHAHAYFDRFCVGATWTLPRARGIDWHPTPKSVALMREIVSSSVPPGGSVLDPFAGSAAVGEAVLRERRNRTYHGIEIDETWATLARKRLDDVYAGMTRDMFIDGAA